MNIKNNNYDILVVNGCSFSEGGGLNNPEIFEFLNNKKFENGNELDEFMYNNNYAKFLSDKLNIPFVNISKSCSSNDYIFHRSYKLLNSLLEQGKKILIINQLSIFTRLSFRLDNCYYSYNFGGRLSEVLDDDFEKKEWNYKNFEEESKDVYDTFYEIYATHIYDEKYYIENLKMQIDLFNKWCEAKNITNHWLSYEVNDVFYDIDRYIDCDGDSISEWAIKNKLLLSHIENIPVKDEHLSIEGHKKLTEIIHKKIN